MESLRVASTSTLGSKLGRVQDHSPWGLGTFLANEHTGDLGIVHKYRRARYRSFNILTELSLEFSLPTIDEGNGIEVCHLRISLRCGWPFVAFLSGPSFGSLCAHDKLTRFK